MTDTAAGSLALPAFRTNAKIIGREVAWCDTDIQDVVRAIVASGVAICGIESVRLPCGEANPLVVAISDCSYGLKSWKLSFPWERCVERSGDRAIEDIERNENEPYGADVWYLIYGVNAGGTLVTADP